MSCDLSLKLSGTCIWIHLYMSARSKTRSELQMNRIMQVELLPLLLSAVLSLALVNLLLRMFHRNPNHHSSPPSPWRLPFLGNLHQLGPLAHQSLHRLSKTHGPVMLLHLGATPTLVVSSPAAACEITKTHDLIFASRPSMIAADRLFYRSQDVVFAPYGDYWRRMRKVCNLHLLNSKMVQNFRDVREEEVADMVRKVRETCLMGLVNLTEILHSLSNAVMCRAALGDRCSSKESGRRKEMCNMISEVSALLGEFHAEDFFPWIGSLWSVVSGTRSRFRRCSEKIDGLLERALRDHRGGGGDETGDFVDVLLSLQSDCSSGVHLSDDNVKAIVLDMLGAGTDTPFITLEWTMAELIKNPQVLSKVQDEVSKLVAEENAFPPPENSIAQLEYMDAVIKESMRLHPPAPLLVPRESISEARVHGYTIPSGTRILLNAWSMGRNPTSWDEPEEFKPERFLVSGTDFRGQDHRYIPFGSGRRECPGMTFAIYLVKVAIFNLLHHFDWEVSGHEDLNMEEMPGLNTPRKNPLLVAARPRPNVVW